MCMTLFLQKIKNDELIQKIKYLVKEERRIQVELLLHLKEIERRRLYLELGYGSLFDFVIKELGYSESSGFRRIQAMRLMKSVPEIEQKICDGSFSLTAASQVQTFVKAEEKLNGPVSKVVVQELVQTLQNKSSREIEKHLLSLKPVEQLVSEKVRQVTETHTEIKLVIPDQLKQTLDQLKLLLSHISPEMSYQDLFAYLADKAIKQLDPAKKTNAVSNSLPAPKVNSVSAKTVVQRSRYIPNYLKTEVWIRDKGCCTFVSDENGKICGSKFQVQIDHIHPFALGGINEIGNLRLLCAQHNRWYAEKVFGLGRSYSLRT